MRTIFVALLFLSIYLLQMTQGRKHGNKDKRKPCCGGDKASVSTDKPLAPKKMASNKVNTQEPAVEETKKENGGCCHGKKDEHHKQAAAATSDKRPADGDSSRSLCRFLTGWNLVILLGGILGVLAAIFILQTRLTGKK